MAAKAGESGKLFGTITTKKLSEELLAKSGIDIDRKNITVNAPINKVGEYKMTIKLTSKVKTELSVVVSASEILKEGIEEVQAEPSTEEYYEGALSCMQDSAFLVYCGIMKDKKQKLALNCLAIGSLPHEQASEAMKLVNENFKFAPFWAQLAKLNKSEDMIVQFLEAMPGVVFTEDKIYFDNESEDFLLSWKSYF